MVAATSATTTNGSNLSPRSHSKSSLPPITTSCGSIHTVHGLRAALVRTEVAASMALLEACSSWVEAGAGGDAAEGASRLRDGCMHVLKGWEGVDGTVEGDKATGLRVGGG